MRDPQDALVLSQGCVSATKIQLVAQRQGSQRSAISNAMTLTHQGTLTLAQNQHISREGAVLLLGSRDKNQVEHVNSGLKEVAL